MTRANHNGLDAIGWNILAALQENARISFADLGRRVGLTAPAVAERVRQMEDAGIIRGYRADVGLDRLGLGVTAVIRISAPEEKCPALKAAIQALPEITECHHVTGTDSYVLRAITTSVGHLEAVIETLGRWGTPTTAIILSSPVPPRGVSAPPASWPLARAASRRTAAPAVATGRRR
jgi:Lrp/AsnC family transcriptional regulator, leucine-responsive regulatory protein